MFFVKLLNRCCSKAFSQKGNLDFSKILKKCYFCMYDSSLQVQGTKTEITCLLCSTNRLLIVMNDQRMLLLPHIDVNCIIEKSSSWLVTYRSSTISNSWVYTELHAIILVSRRSLVQHVGLIKGIVERA